jgi:Family of unknown function (DUF5908)
MPIEVRELQVRSRVDSSIRPASAGGAAEAAAEWQLERLRESVLAECKALVAAALRERQER